MPLLLKLKPSSASRPPGFDAACLCPDRIAGLPRAEVERLPLPAGRGEAPLGDLFEVSGEDSEEIEVEGDLTAFSRVGAAMTRGRLVVRGPVGSRAGAGMRGGVLLVQGSAGDYAGEGMTGGLLRVRGNAGDHVAAPAPGGARGMNRGTILIEGNAGRVAAARMRRGIIAIAGDAGEGAACGMLAGSLFVFGRAGRGAGALLRRGSILALGGLDCLPTWLPSGSYRFPFLEIFFDALESAGFRVPARARRATYRRHVGDASGGGTGEILVPAEIS